MANAVIIAAAVVIVTIGAACAMPSTTDASTDVRQQVIRRLRDGEGEHEVEEQLERRDRGWWCMGGVEVRHVGGNFIMPLEGSNHGLRRSGRWGTAGKRSNTAIRRAAALVGL
jgi:hypothetical protein